MSQKLDEKYLNMDESKQKMLKVRHTAEHVLHTAMQKLYPNLKKAMGPATDEGFYFDFDLEDKVSDADFPAIEKEMARIIKSESKMIRREIEVSEAKEIFAGNPYKMEWVEDISARGESLSTYQMTLPSGKVIDEDLCSGPHLDSVTEIGAFKLLSVAGAYWHGDEKNKMLTRIYGTAFETQEELDKFMWQLEEAKKRDHRKLGEELKLFFIDETVGKGLIMWLPNGTIIKNEIEKLAIELEEEGGYKRVSTPHIAKEDLYLTSGHLPYYKDSMYPPMVMDDGTYYLKAMNCPHHHRIFGHSPKSYRDFPIRLAEYGMCYRNELSGALQGLLRVRGMEMNDAHIYCRKDQIKQEFRAVLELTMKYLGIFGFTDYSFRLSKWSPEHIEKYIDQPENWKYAEGVLREILTEMKVKFVEAEDEAAFYGPKVDVQVKSVVGREESMSTVQLDFLAKERFGLKYVDNTGLENNDVFVIHRAPLSTHERFMAFLIEHYAGVFPVWLSPVQVAVLPISEKTMEFSEKVTDELKKTGIRVELNTEADSLGKKIRNAEATKVPYMLILGEKEVESGTVSVRQHGQKDLGSMSIADFVEKVVKENKEKTIN